MNTSDLDLDAFDAIEDTTPEAPQQPSEDSTLSLVAEAGEQRGPTIGQQATGLAIEAGGGIGGVYATQKAMQSAKVAKGLNILKKIRRGGQAAAIAGAAGPQVAEPISTGLGLLTFGVTEAVWAVGLNWVKQEYFKGLGVQEETSGGELLTSLLLVSPLIKQGERIPKLGKMFDPSMIKSRTWKVGAHTVQGATIGAVESSIRQTWDLMADEDADLGDFSFQDLAQGTVLGGGMGGVASLGADGIKLVRAYRKVVARNKVEMRGSLVERLAKLDKTITKAEKLGSNRQRIVAEMHAAKAKKELDELDAVHDSMDEELGNVEAGLLSQEKKPEVETPAPKTPFKNTTGDEAIDVQLTKTETMTPDEYLRQAWEATDGKMGGTYESWLASNKLTDADRAKYAQAMKDGDEFPLPYIDKYRGSQDGRNRALAAKEAGIEEIPVGIIEEPSVDVQLKDLRAELETTTSKMGKARIQEKINNLETTPAPKTPEASPMQQLRDKYKRAIADQDEGKGALDVVELDANFRVASDDFSKRVDAMIADTSPENVASVSEIIDDYIEMDELDAKLRQKTGQMQRGHRKDAGDVKFTNEMSENRQTRQEALQGVREKLDTLKEDGGGDDVQKLVDKIFGEPVEAPRPAKKTPTKKTTPQKDGETETPTTETTTAPKTKGKNNEKEQIKNAVEDAKEKREKLEKELEKHRQRFGDDSADLESKKKKEKKEDPNKDIKARIAAYKKFESEALALDKSERELKRLEDVIERGDPDELKFEGITKPELLKSGKAAGRVEGLKKEISEKKKAIREQLEEPKAPKKTPKERAVARLQKRLDELRAIRSSTADELETPAKPKRAKSAEEKDLEDRIKFYTGETKELDDIVAMNERIEVLSGLMRGESMEAIQAQIGLPAKLKPSYLKPKKIESELTRLKDTEKRLMKMLRRRQTDELLNDLKDAFDPENGQRSPVDRLLNKYLEERTDALLNQPSTVTTGLPSGIIQVMWRPTVGTARSAVKAASPLDSDLKGVGMTQRMKFAAADVIATFDQLVSVASSPVQTSVQVGRNLADTVKAGGQSAFFYKDGNKIDMNEGATVGNATIRNTKKVDQAAMRVAANQQKGAITRTAMKMLASDPAAALFAAAKGLRAAGRTGVGSFDEPFIMILEGRRVRADAYREAIKQQPSDPAAFIDNYIANATTVDKQGVKRFNYLDEKYKDGANEVRKGLFRRADLEADDYRVQTEEHVTNFWGKLTGGDPTMGKFFLRFMQPIFTTPTIGLIQSGRNVAHTKGLPLAANVGQRAYSEVAKRTGKNGKISNILSGRLNREINDHEIEIEKLKTEKKKEGLEPDEIQKLDDELAATEQQLKSAVAYRTEKLYDDIAHTALMGGMAMAAFEAGRQGLISGAGSFLERDQRNNGEFEKYRGLADKDSVGWNYLLGDPFRTVVALYADLGARSVLEEEGKLTEQQNWGNFITSTMEAYATDAVFSTSLRQMKDLAFGQEKSRTDAVIDIAAGALLVPAWARNLNSFNDETYSVHGQGAEFRDIPDRAMQKALGNEAENYRVDKLGRPLKRNERGPLNYAFRYAPEERARRMQAEEEVRNVLRADSFQHNLFPTFPKAPRINGVSIPLDKFTKGRKTLLTVFHEMANENDDFLHELGDLVTSEDWLDDYANYEITENPTNPEKPYNEGMKRLVDVRDEYIEKAKTQLQDPSSDAQFYRNKDGQTIYEYIESFSTPTEETNRTVPDLLKIH